MKVFKLAIMIVAVMLGFTACQNELEIQPGVSVGTLQDTAGNCRPVTINGIYRMDSVLTSDNFIDVHINVTTIGSFTVETDSVNGFIFKGSGNFGNTGDNRVRLYGSGKPVVGGISKFTIKYGTSVCVVDVTVLGPGGGAAIYTLGGSPGSCSGFTLGSGTYVAGQVLVAANTVLTNVNVTATGTFDHGTDTVNGIYFRGSGAFVNLGVQSITLAGHGTPVAAGTFTYKLTNGATTCTFSITVVPVGGSGTAVYTLGGSPGSCTGVIATGSYLQGVPLTSANTVKVNIDVVTPGSYSITVAAVNGVSFSSTGSFTVTGPQQLTLNGTGTPAATGTFNYVINGPGGTTCTFPITYGSAPPPPNQEYIPMTTSSNWSTKLVGGGPGDTTYMQVSPNTIVKGAETYHIFELKDTGTPIDSLFFRKVANGKYYQFFDDDFGILDAPFAKDILILDSTLGVGATWTVSLGSNSIGGTPLTAKINNEILAKGAAVTVAGNNYINVIKVKYTYIGDIGLGDLTVAEEERWYAKGYGVIYSNLNILLPAPDTQEVETTRIQIF